MKTEKKDPGRHSIRFKLTDPLQQWASEILEDYGRGQAVFLANVLNFYYTSTTGEGFPTKKPKAKTKQSKPKVVKPKLSEAMESGGESTSPLTPIVSMPELNNHVPVITISDSSMNNRIDESNVINIRQPIHTISQDEVEQAEIAQTEAIPLQHPPSTQQTSLPPQHAPRQQAPQYHPPEHLQTSQQVQYPIQQVQQPQTIIPPTPAPSELTGVGATGGMEVNVANDIYNNSNANIQGHESDLDIDEDVGWLASFRSDQ